MILNINNIFMIITFFLFNFCKIGLSNTPPLDRNFERPKPEWPGCYMWTRARCTGRPDVEERFKFEGWTRDDYGEWKKGASLSEANCEKRRKYFEQICKVSTNQMKKVYVPPRAAPAPKTKEAGCWFWSGEVCIPEKKTQMGEGVKEALWVSMKEKRWVRDVYGENKYNTNANWHNCQKRWYGLMSKCRRGGDWGKYFKVAWFAPGTKTKKEPKKLTTKNGCVEKVREIGGYKDKADRAFRYGPKARGYDKNSCEKACKEYKYFALQSKDWCSCENNFSQATKYGTARCGKTGGEYCNYIYEKYTDCGSSSPSSSSSSSSCFEKDTDRYGGNLKNIGNVESANACLELCKKETSCAAFTYVTSTYSDSGLRKICILKKSVESKSTKTGLISGVMKNCNKKEVKEPEKPTRPGCWIWGSAVCENKTNPELQKLDVTKYIRDDNFEYITLISHPSVTKSQYDKMCRENLSSIASACNVAENTLKVVSNYISEPEDPTKPGCYIWSRFGCENKTNNPQVPSLDLTKYIEDKGEGRGGQTACDGGSFEWLSKECNVPGFSWAYVSVPGPSPSTRGGVLEVAKRIQNSCFEKDIDRYGGDLKHFKNIASEKKCLELCKQNSSCVAFTYITSTFRAPRFRRRCYLKKVISGKRGKKGLISGIVKNCGLVRSAPVKGQIKLVAGRQKSEYFMLEKGVNGCPNGNEIKSLNECKEAIARFGKVGNVAWDGNNNSFPSFCSAGSTEDGEYGTFTPFFNTNSNGKNNGNFTPMCKRGIGWADKPAPKAKAAAAAAAYIITGIMGLLLSLPVFIILQSYIFTFCYNYKLC